MNPAKIDKVNPSKIVAAVHFRIRFISLTNCRRLKRAWGSWYLCAFDQEPEHDCQFAKQKWLRKPKGRIIVGYSEQRDRAQCQPSQTVNHKPNADDAWQKSGAVDE